MRTSICVILCTYNGERYLRPQIDSILSQRLPVCPGSEMPALTLHIFDDCSTDGTRAILEKYRQADPERVYLHLREQPSGGACANFLDAIHNAPDADLYLLSDQDDIWDDDKVASLLGALHAQDNGHMTDDTPVLLFSDARVILECAAGADAKDVRVISDSFVRFQRLSPERTDLNRLLVMNQVTGAACMFNRGLRELIASVTVPVHAVMHDHFMALTTSAFGRIIYLDKALYSYRQHDSNVLGAQKGGMLLEVKKRLGLAGRSKKEMDKASRDGYDALLAQAQEFWGLYEHQLSDGQKRMLQAFISLRELPRICRIAVILRYGFTFNRLYRTIGELLYL